MDLSLSIQGALYRQTLSIATTSSSALLTTVIDAAVSAASLTAIDWAQIRAILITCETNDARISFGVAASATLGHILFTNGSMRITNNSLIRAARIIDRTSGSHATLMVTLEY